VDKAAFLPGQEPPRHKDIDDAAEAYVDARDKRMAAGRVEQELYAALATVMHEHKLEFYPIPGTDQAVTCDKSEKFKVGKMKVEDPE
jgi:hypothetical protein